MSTSTTFLKRTAVLLAVAAIAAPVASATITDSHDRTSSGTHAAQGGGDALDRYLANRRRVAEGPDALERYLANHRPIAPDALDRFLRNVQSGNSAGRRFIQRRGGV